MKSGIASVAFVALIVTTWPVNTATAQTKPDKIRIGYAARAVAHSVPFVAKEAGFFTEEGIDAEIVRTAGSIAPMALVANEVDLAIMSAYLMIPVAVQNNDVVMLGGFSRYASMVFVARPEVKGAQDLKGKIVGIQRPGDAYEKSARFALRHLGLDADKDVKMLALGTNDVMWSALQTGRVIGDDPIAAGNSVRAQSRNEFHGRSHGSQTGISRLDDRDPAVFPSEKSTAGDARAARHRARRASVQNAQRRHDANSRRNFSAPRTAKRWKNRGTMRRRCRRNLMRWRARFRPCSTI